MASNIVHVCRFCSNGIVPKNSVNLFSSEALRLWERTFQEECVLFFRFLFIPMMIPAAGLVCESLLLQRFLFLPLRVGVENAFSTRTLQGARKRGKNSSGPDVSWMHSLCQSDLWVELLGEDLLLSLVRHFCVCHSLVNYQLLFL